MPHTTHLVQPLDVVCFQPYKHWYGKAVAKAYAEGCTDFNKMELLSALHEIRVQAFKSTTILSAWKKTGLFPFNPAMVLGGLQPLVVETPPNTPPGDDELHTLDTVRGLTRLAEYIMDEQTIEEESEESLDSFVRGSLAIAQAASIQYRQLARFATAEKRRQQQRKDARKSIQQGGTMYVEHGREAVAIKEEQQLEAARLKYERLQKVQENRAKAAQKRREIDARKAAKLAKKNTLIR